MTLSNLRARQAIISEVIRTLGGTKAVADMFDVVPSAVSNWRSLGRFPARTYMQLTRKLKTKGKHVPAHLGGMHHGL